jgi:hypothetical protein
MQGKPEASLITLDSEWVNLVYKTCSEAIEVLNPNRTYLAPDDEGLLNLSEVVVLLYEELHKDPTYRLPKGKVINRVLH